MPFSVRVEDYRNDQTCNMHHVVSACIYVIVNLVKASRPSFLGFLNTLELVKAKVLLNFMCARCMWKEMIIIH